MTTNEWVDVCGEALERASVDHFHPLEIADVGREVRSEFIAKSVVILDAPQPHLIPYAVQLCRVLCDLRAAVRPMPVLVNSWYRSRLYNHRIGGVRNSMHLTCGAADVTKVGFTPDEVADILENHPDADKFGIGRYKNFVHLDIRGMLGRSAPARW